MNRDVKKIFYIIILAVLAFTLIGIGEAFFFGKAVFSIFMIGSVAIIGLFLLLSTYLSLKYEVSSASQLVLTTICTVSSILLGLFFVNTLINLL